MCKATEGAAIAFWFVSSPTPRIEMTVLYPSFLATVTPGATELKPTKSVMFLTSSSELVMAVTDCETSCKLSLRFSAMTITSSISAAFTEESVAIKHVIKVTNRVLSFMMYPYFCP